MGFPFYTVGKWDLQAECIYPILILTCWYCNFKIRGEIESPRSAVSFECIRGKFYAKDRNKLIQTDSKTWKRNIQKPTKGIIMTYDASSVYGVLGQLQDGFSS